MILKKPYALLIKYFRLLHAVLTILVAYLVYRINILLKFFNTYMDNQTSVVGQNLKDNLFSISLFIIPLIIFIISISLLWLMIRKRKPYKFYLINTFVNIYCFIVVLYTSFFIEGMQSSIVSLVSVRVVRDLLSISIFLQSLSLIVLFIRAIGFDIKKFEFMADLQNLEISDEDREEYEVEFSFDSNERRRKRKRKLRYLKYTYKENKIFINILLILIVSFICYFIYNHMGIYVKTNNEGSILSTNYYNMSVDNSYIINKSYKGDIITTNYLLLINLKIKTISDRNKLVTSNFKLKIGDNEYITTNYYDKYLIDLGKVYDNDKLTNDYNNYLLVYEIPKEETNKKDIKLVYLEEKKNIKFKLKPIRYREDCIKEFSVNEDITLSNDNLVNISSYEIQDKFDIKYDYCIKNDCFESHQLLVPTLNTNYDKAILKIVGSANIKENNLYNNFNKLLSNTVTINYTLNGIDKESDFSKVSNIKKEEDNTYYYEVNKELMSAEKIKLIFNTRECKYLYNFK